MDTTYDILIIEDSTGDANLYKLYFSKSTRNQYNIDICTTGFEGLTKIQENPYSCIILDQHLPDMDAADFVERADIESLITPIVIITGYSDDKIDQKMLQMGVADYLDKSEVVPHSLERIVLHAIERYSMVQQLKLANLSKEKFLSEASKEIKRPLEALIKYCDAFFNHQKDYASPKQLMDIIQHIYGSAKEQKTSIDKLLRRSIIDEKHKNILLSNTNINEEIEKYSLPYKVKAEKKGVKFIVKPFSKDVIVSIDQSKFWTAYECLLHNAVKFTDNGIIEVELVMDAQAVNLRVRDTGIGINCAFLDKIFFPFTHANNEIMQRFGGLGNGLAIASFFIQLHGGKIGVKTVPLEGSEFDIHIPIRESPKKEQTKLVSELHV